jgi:hypothetical protein
MTRLNNPELCIVCARRADGMAVGKPDRLGWFCIECGPERAKEALAMGRKLDEVEKRAAKRVAALCDTAITLEPKELPEFVEWAVQEFAKAMRQEVKEGVPF